MTEASCLSSRQPQCSSCTTTTYRRRLTTSGRSHCTLLGMDTEARSCTELSPSCVPSHIAIAPCVMPRGPLAHTLACLLLLRDSYGAFVIIMQRIYACFVDWFVNAHQFMAQGGDITKHNGCGGRSSFGHRFAGMFPRRVLRRGRGHSSAPQMFVLTSS
jgi:hypothetical protein